MATRMFPGNEESVRAAPWRIELLGGIGARRGRTLVTEFRTRRAAILLARLALNPRPHRREELISMLWPESAPSAGRQNLSQALSELRRRLEAPHQCEFVFAGREAVWLDREMLQTDVEDFEKAMAAAHAATDESRIRHLEEAVAIAHAPLLPGVSYDWAEASRERISAECDAALRQLVAHYEQAGDLAAAFECAWRRVRIDPLDEEAHREFAHLYERSGRPAAALHHLHEMERELTRRLGVEPDSESRALGEALRARLMELASHRD
jgi:DNA-binding SARP family transcriptional activator